MTKHSSEGRDAILDLSKFCGSDESRLYLHKPFSIGKFTYATNGHIMVRVAKRANVPFTKPDFPIKNADGPLAGWDSATYQKMEFLLPPEPERTGDCDECDGYGSVHDCPSCDCVCRACAGTGDANPEWDVSTTIGGANFALGYVRHVLSLPDVELVIPTEAKKPMLYRFAGGIGALMPLRGEKSTHVSIALAEQAVR